jgi:hypothetical protein
MAFDSARGSMLMFGGYTTYADNFMDTWELAGLAGPLIQTQPANTVIPELGHLELSVQAQGSAPLAYQWYRGTHAIEGATSPTLIIDPVRRTDAGSYYVEISNACASVQSVRAGVTVTPCRANWNQDAWLDSTDFFDFLSDFFASPPSADFNGDGQTTSADFFEFLAAWFEGC